MEAVTTDNYNQLVSDECDNHEVAHDSQSQNQVRASGGSPLRRGKWAAEEEAYALAAIQDFNSGYLDAQPGTTLRTYLSQALDCDPMRITKKFTGDASIGKKVFHPAARDDPEVLKEIMNAQNKNWPESPWQLRLFRWLLS
ncbi:hypothetical protein ACHAXA_010520 [Cyclostephanos tholiformis]|uniref:Uncharacterized protein n=1 Tax=Cyclostephanos tholiformis TaxID=382380 RepID=A0ABD3SPT2_9STRA